MSINHNIKKEVTASLFREAIPKMSQLDIPLTPENYHTWYEYTLGESLELNKIIDELLKDGVKFTSKVNKDLYDTFIVQAKNELLNAFQKDIKKMLGNLFDKIDGMTKSTKVYSESLEDYTAVLQADPDIEAITGLIENLIDNTGDVLESNQSMKTSLECMSEEVDTLRADLQALNVEALTDKLTAVPNRRAFDNKIEELHNSHQDEGIKFSLLLIDIDNFKKFNDRYGHDIGDMVLRYVAKIMNDCIKGGDMLARYGGEEFMVLLPSTKYENAMTVADMLCKKIASNNLVESNTKEKVKSYGNVTVSIGVVTSATEDDIGSMVKRVDKALYLAKDNGRNQVIGEAAFK